MLYRLQNRAADYELPERATLKDRVLVALDVDSNDEGDRIARAFFVVAPPRSGDDPSGEVRITVWLHDDTVPSGVISVLREPRFRLGGLLPTGVEIWLATAGEARQRRRRPLRVAFEIDHGEGRLTSMALTVSPRTAVEALAALPTEEFHGIGETLTNEQRLRFGELVNELDTPALHDRSGIVTTPREFQAALKPGVSIDFGGSPCKVLEVARLQSTLRVAGVDRPLWLVVHAPRLSEGVGSDSRCSFFAVVFDEQTPWVLDTPPAMPGRLTEETPA